MGGVREGFWWTFSKILRYVKGSGNIFHIYLFEILCHLWGVMKIKKSCCHENCCYGECRHVECRHEKCRHKKCRHEKKLCLLLGLKKFQKDEMKTWFLILHGVGVVRICTNVKFHVFFFLSSFCLLITWFVIFLRYLEVFLDIFASSASLTSLWLSTEVWSIMRCCWSRCWHHLEIRLEVNQEIPVWCVAL